MNRYFVPTFLIAVLLFSSCRRSAPTEPQNSSLSSISIGFLSKDTPPGVSRIVGVLSRAGFDTLTSEFVISGGLAHCDFDNLMVGVWHLEVDAFSAENTLLYTGQTDVTVYSGVTTPVALHLDPATGSISVTVTWGNSDTTSANNAIQFGSGGGSVLIPPSSDFHLQQLTVEMYVQVNNSDTVLVPFLYETGLDEHAQADGFCVKWEQGRLYFRLATQSNLADQISEPYTFKPGQWVHVACTYDHQVLRIYVDGRKIAERSYTADIYYGSSGFSLGQGHHSDFGWLFSLNGAMDEIRIWNYPRTQDQILASMNQSLRGDEPGLVACWSCNEDSSSIMLYDKTSHHHNGYLSGDVSFIPSTAF